MIIAEICVGDCFFYGQSYNSWSMKNILSLILSRLSLPICLLLVPCGLWARESEEALALRRISLLYQDREYVYAQKAIEEFLSFYPESHDKERLIAIMGNIAFESSDYDKALFYYRKLTEDALKTECQKRVWHSLFMLAHYKELTSEVKDLAADNESACFYLAKAILHESLQQNPTDRLMLERALSLFQMLDGSTSYTLDVKEALIAIYRAIGQEQRAQEQLHALAQLLLGQQRNLAESLNLKTATLLAKSAPREAAALLKHLMEKGSKKKREAATLLFSILAKESDFEALMASEKALCDVLAPAHLGLFHFILGKWHHEHHHVEAAMHHLETTLALPLASPYDREALALLVLCSDNPQQEPDHAITALEKAYKEADRRYGNRDTLFAKVELALAHTLTRVKRYEEATVHLDCALHREGISKEALEEATVEKMRLLAERTCWEEADQLAAQTLARGPSKAVHQARVALLGQAALACPGQNYEKRKIEALHTALDAHASLFTMNERETLALTLAKALLTQGNIDDSLSLLKECESTYRSNAIPEELAALLAYAYLKKGNIEQGVSYGEQAAVDKGYATSLALPLFNAYITLARQKQESQFEMDARRHLNHAIEAGLSVSLENRLWLFHCQAAHAELFGDEAQARAALGLIEEFLVETQEVAPYGSTLLTAASLYGLLHESAQGIALIEQWKAKAQAMGCYEATDALAVQAEFVHAKLILALEQREEAAARFERLQEVDFPAIAAGAKLYTARMGYHFSSDKRRLTHDQIRKALGILSDLKSYRDAQSEPMHLEAAIDWVDLATLHLSDHERPRKQLSLLREIKADFSAEDDLVAKDYHELLRRNPDKYHLFTTYMRYLDGSILALEAKITKEESKRKEKEEMADLLFSSIADNTSSYLKARIKTQLRPRGSDL